MKKIAVILLLLVHLFNIGGYALVSAYFINRSDDKIAQQLYSNKIDRSNLVEIQIPMSLPGIPDMMDYEQIDGQITYQGNYYHYVSIKMAKGIVSMLCVPNQTKDRLTKANVNITKQLADIPLGSKKGHEPLAKKSGIGQDYSFNHVVAYHFSAYAFATASHVVNTPTMPAHPYIKSPGKPPNFSC